MMKLSSLLGRMWGAPCCRDAFSLTAVDPLFAVVDVFPQGGLEYAGSGSFGCPGGNQV